MGKDLRRTIKEINKGKNLDENLPVYIKMMQKAYGITASLHLAINYETFFEQLMDKEEVSSDISGIFLRLEGYMGQILKGQTECREGIIAERNDITEKMEVITACVDRLSNGEYVYNRMELNFKERVRDWPEVSDLTARLVQFIIINKDTAITNERIRNILGQLPVRMGRSHFYELIKNGLGLYKDGDAQALDSILYVLKTAAGLYHSEGSKKHFTDLQDEIAEIEALDYGKMTEDGYDKAGEKIKKLSDSLYELSDAYMSLQTIINEMLALCLLWEDGAETVPDKVMSILEKENEILAYHKYKNDKEGVLEAVSLIGQMFVSLEGMQEENMERQNLLEAVLEEAASECRGMKKERNVMRENALPGKPPEENSGQKGQIRQEKNTQGNIEKKLNRLLTVQRLLGSSQFADIGILDEKSTGKISESGGNEKVSLSEVREKTAELINEFDAYFKTHSQKLNRAVMASVLSKLPVFFSTVAEIKDYIEASLIQCRDESEKRISMELLEQMMDEAAVDIS